MVGTGEAEIQGFDRVGNNVVRNDEAVNQVKLEAFGGFGGKGRREGFPVQGEEVRGLGQDGGGKGERQQDPAARQDETDAEIRNERGDKVEGGVRGPRPPCRPS